MNDYVHANKFWHFFRQPKNTSMSSHNKRMALQPFFSPHTIVFLYMLIILLCTFGGVHYLQMRRNIRPQSKIEIFKDTFNETHKCTITMLINTMKRPRVEFLYLQKTLASIDAMANEFFQPCVVIGALYHDEMHEIAQLARKSAPHIQSMVVPVKMQHGFASASPLTERKRQQASDVYSSLQFVNEHVCKHPSQRLALMEDDFIFCDNAYLHLMHILTHTNYERHAGARFSYGLNGVMLFCVDLPRVLELLFKDQHSDVPIDWVVEYITVNHLYRPYLTYRYQLMEHIGFVSAVGNRHWDYQYPLCMEALHSASMAHDYDLDKCAHTLFWPCVPTSSVPDRIVMPENTFLPTTQSTHGDSLASIQHLVPTKCERGWNCKDCCAKQQLQCKPEYFKYVNDCNLLQKHFKCSSHECMVDWGRLERTSPHLDAKYGCIVASRTSRMLCDTARNTDARLCPCA